MTATTITVSSDRDYTVYSTADLGPVACYRRTVSGRYAVGLHYGPDVNDRKWLHFDTLADAQAAALTHAQDLDAENTATAQTDFARGLASHGDPLLFEASHQRALDIGRRALDIDWQQDLERTGAQPPQVLALHREFDEYTRTTSILTLTGLEGEETMTIDLHRDDSGALLYGYHEQHRLLMNATLNRFVRTGGVVVLRSFLDERDARSGLPVKELRAWVSMGTEREGHQCDFGRLPAGEVKSAFGEDHVTGELLASEPAVLYR